MVRSSLTCSLSWPPIFVPNHLQGLECGATKQGQHTKRDHAKQVLKQDFILISLLVVLSRIPKDVKNLFQAFHLDGSVWFRY